MARNYAALLHEYLEEMELLSDAEFGRICRALLRYSKNGEIPALSGSERVLFPRVKMQEDRFQESYKDMLESRREAGKKGASARWEKETLQAMANDGKLWQAMANDGKNGKTKTKTKTNNPSPNGDKGLFGGREAPKRRKTAFVPPTLDEVRAYVRERNSPVIPEEFIDFYAAKDWMVGKNKMADWKAACRNAEKWDRWSHNAGSKMTTGGGIANGILDSNSGTDWGHIPSATDGCWDEV